MTRSLRRGLEMPMDALSVAEIKVSEAMSHAYGLAGKELTLREALDLMSGNGWDEALVLDQGAVIGVVTRERLLKLLSGEAPPYATLERLCGRKVITTRADSSLLPARDLMRRHNIGRMPVLDEKGAVVGVLSAKDICNGFSSRLETVGEHMRAIMENIVEAIQVVNCSGLVTFWNHGAEKIFGIRAEHISGLPLRRFLPDDPLLELLSGGAPQNNLLMEYKPGLFLLRSCALIKTASGELIGAVCTSLDVSRHLSLMHMLDATAGKVKRLEAACAGEEREQSFYTTHPETRRVLEQARRAAATSATVLIQGESGTGKELLAQEIHRRSVRSGRPLVEVNCGAIPENLFESEMFGYEGGAFTGGHQRGKKGKFELAHAGTIFFDEIAEIPPDSQAKLLRAIQERRFYRLGGNSVIDVDVRIIAATNRRLAELVKAGKFRQDLYYRLNVVCLDIPPLRERPGDIPGLIELFARKLCKIHQRALRGISPDFSRKLSGLPWPGNARQLYNTLENLIILMEGDEITLRSMEESNARRELEDMGLPAMSRAPAEAAPASEGSALEQSLMRHEKDIILRCLQDNRFNKSRTALDLGIPRATLYYRMKSLGIRA